MKVLGKYLLLLFFLEIHLFLITSADTNSKDETPLDSLKKEWKNTPSNWEKGDPCGPPPWDGVICKNSRVTELRLSNMGLIGPLSALSDIAQLQELHALDLSSNKELNGPIPASIGNFNSLTYLSISGCSLSGTIPAELGNLKLLSYLSISGCSLSGTIPAELGNLKLLSYLDLSCNNLTGSIPASLGQLSNVVVFDLASNQLTGSFPVSTRDSPGLDLLHNAEHFHLNNNRLNGSIPGKLFNSNMTLIHILFFENQLVGTIPSTVGLVTTLEILRLDRNLLTGPVPSNLNNLTKLNFMSLASNQLSGPLPNLTGMKSLNNLDLSHNSFDPSEAPLWFFTLQSLITITMEDGALQGQVPQALFTSRQLQTVVLRKNRFNGTLDMGNGGASQLQLVNLQDNDITNVKQQQEGQYADIVLLEGNPACKKPELSNSHYCLHESKPYTPSLGTCTNKSCPKCQKVNPGSCECAYPYEGTLVFWAPNAPDASNETLFHSLEVDLCSQLNITPGSVSLQGVDFTSDGNLELRLQIFPATGKCFNLSEIQGFWWTFANRIFDPPKEIGLKAYRFSPSPYMCMCPVGSGVSKSRGVIIGIAAGCAFLVVLLLLVGIYAMRQKRRVEIAIELGSRAERRDSTGAPQLKGARWFFFEEIKSCTNNFSPSNEIGSGGFGMVYKGVLPNGQMVAIKRSKERSMQGGLEFNTEIELLSRVHHKNLVGLMGYCFENGEKMLVYEFLTNGSLRDILSGKTSIILDWGKRLRIALGSAKGLAYLHEHANPPIIHRDVKSSNILLDESLTAKVADFGISKLVTDEGKNHISTQVKGTVGYMDPEYFMTQQLTEKSDVYSFGVVMLELLTTKKPIEMGKYIVREVQTAMDRNDDELCGLKEMLDPVIRGKSGLVGFEKFLKLAMCCVKESGVDRPTMSEVVKEIETILQTHGAPTPLHGASLPKVLNYDVMDYSGGYMFSATVEPK